MNLRRTVLKTFFQPFIDVIRGTFVQARDAHLLLVASSLAYTTILSIIPLLAVSFAVFKAFGGLNKLYQTIEPFIISNLAEGASDEVLTRIQGFISNIHESAVGAGGFVGLIFTSMSMLSSVENAINRIWHTRSKRNWFQKISSYWLFVTLGPLALAIALGFATTAEIPLYHFFPSGTGIFVITVAAFFGVYKFVPATPVAWPYALLAAIVTSIFWNLARIGYGLYTTHFVSYNKIYGSLGAIPIFMLWIYIIWLIILTGAAFCAALQKSRGTTPPPNA